MTDELREWLKNAGNESFQKINDSDIYAGIVSPGFLANPLCALQLGYALLLDKPIFLVVDQNIVLPKRLQAIADRIEIINLKDRESAARIGEAVKEFVESQKGKP